MEGGRVLFDASSCMLFEASGDSEAGFIGTAAAAAEDDAQSCSCGQLSDTAAIHDEIDVAEDDFNSADIIDECVEKVVEEEDGGEVEDGVVDQFCGGGKAAEMEVAGEDEEEADRLFWEACLAS